jgi:hypothetical protein
MDRWEFCYVDLLNRTHVRFTSRGLERTKCKKDKNIEDDSKEDATARTVAELGLDGWELTNGVGDVSPVLFFKRRLS